jgi:hypothetical protein
MEQIDLRQLKQKWHHHVRSSDVICDPEEVDRTSEKTTRETADL